jgi:hypothetical protein
VTWQRYDSSLQTRTRMPYGRNSVDGAAAASAYHLCNEGLPLTIIPPARVERCHPDAIEGGTRTACIVSSMRQVKRLFIASGIRNNSSRIVETRMGVMRSRGRLFLEHFAPFSWKTFEQPLPSLSLVFVSNRSVTAAGSCKRTAIQSQKRRCGHL